MKCILDGELREKEQVDLLVNRAFRYGDGLFESMRFENGRVAYLHDHCDRLKHGMSVMHMENNSCTDPATVSEFIRILCNDSNLTSARIRLQVYRKEGGSFLPSANTASFLLEAGPVGGISGTPLRIGIFEGYKKVFSALSSFKTCSSAPNVMAALYAQKNDLGDCLFLNDKGNIVEAVSSNVFIVINGEIFTPPLLEGPVDGVLRKQLLKMNDVQVHEQAIAPELLNVASEVFLTNAVTGITPVHSFGANKYSAEVSAELQSKIRF